MRVAVAVALTVLVLTTAAPASAVDADHRLGEGHRQDRPVPLPGSARPGCHCLRVRTVPVSSPVPSRSDLLYLPCQDEVDLPPAKPWGDRPPIIVPVVPRS